MKNLFNDDCPYLSLDEKITAIEDFGDEAKPALIFEGKTDVSIYSRVLKLSDTDLIKKVDIVVGECKSNILTKHLERTIPFKYIALIDVDFDYFNNTMLEDDYIVYTHFYDMENYLTTTEVIEKTFRDMDDIKTGKISIETLYTDMIDCLYPYVAAIKYKLHYLVLSDEETECEKLFSIEDKSIFNEKWWDKREKRIDIDLMKKFIIDFCNTNNETFDEELWNKIISESKEELLQNKEIIQHLIKGRRLIEVYKNVFDNYLGNITQNRNREIFKNDLRKNINISKYVKQLVSNLNLKLQTIV